MIDRSKSTHLDRVKLDFRFLSKESDNSQIDSQAEVLAKRQALQRRDEESDFWDNVPV